MIKVAVTGTIASGKSTLTTLMKRHGIPVFNSDRIANLCLRQTHPAYREIVDYFGGEILDENGEIVRSALAAKIFGNEEKRLKLNSIVHPYVKERLLKFFENVSDSRIACAEVPLLFETDWAELFDEIFVVTCSKEEAVRRMMEDRSYTEEEALKRYESQLDPEKQIAMATRVFRNEGTVTELNQELNRWLRETRGGRRDETESG